MKAADTPAKVLKYWAKSAADPAQVNVIPLDYAGSGLASFDLGYPPECLLPIAGGGKPPKGQDENGIYRFITKIEQWFNAGAGFFYDATFSAAIGGYPKGAILNSALANGAYWISLVDDNVTNPDTGGAGWLTYTPLNLYAADTGTKNALAIALAPAATNAFFTGKPITVLKAGNTNDAPATLTIGVNAPLAIVHTDGSALSGGELSGNFPLLGVPDGNGNFVLLSGSSGRQRLANNLTLYVNGATGNDANSGLTAGTPFATLQRAWDVAFTNYDLNGNVVNVSIADFAYTAGVSASGRLLGAKRTSSLRYFSASGNPAACTVTSSGNTLNVSDGAAFAIQNIKVSSTGGAALLIGGAGCRIENLGGVVFGPATSAHIVVNDGGRYNLNDNAAAYSITGSAPYHIDADANAVVTNTPTSAVVITLSGTPAFTAFVRAQDSSSLLFSNQVSFSGGATGSRYNAALNGVINTGGQGASYLPGSTAGATATGGQYA